MRLKIKQLGNFHGDSSLIDQIEVMAGYRE
jgi:hypothetical protein